MVVLSALLRTLITPLVYLQTFLTTDFRFSTYSLILIRKSTFLNFSEPSLSKMKATIRQKRIWKESIDFKLHDCVSVRHRVIHISTLQFTSVNNEMKDIHTCIFKTTSNTSSHVRCRRCPERMVFGFTTTCANSAYHH